MTPIKSRHAVFVLLVGAALEGCSTVAVRIDGTQDGIRVAQSVPTPIGGRIGAGRLSASGSFRGDVLSNSDAQSGQRTPPLSGAALVGIGFTGGDAALDCRFAEARLGVRTNPMLAEANPHTGAVWRCGLGLRYAVEVGPRLQMLFGATVSVENALIHRDIRYRRTVTDHLDRLVETTTVMYRERRVVGLVGAAFHMTLQYDPHRFVALETALALMVPPTIPRTVSDAWRSSGFGRDEPTVDDLAYYQSDVAGMAWFGAAFGPEFARLALRVNGTIGGAAASSGAYFGAEAALVMSTQVFNPAPARPPNATRSWGTRRD